MFCIHFFIFICHVSKFGDGIRAGDHDRSNQYAQNNQIHRIGNKLGSINPH